MKQVMFALLLAIVWLVWSGIFTPLMLSFGALSIFITLWVASRLKGVTLNSCRPYICPRAPLYWLWLFKEMLLSSITVTRKVWQVKPDISPAFGWVKASQKTEEARVFFANSITLTPGTVSCAMEGNDILVHALESSGLKDLAGGKMDRNVTKTYE